MRVSVWQHPSMPVDLLHALTLGDVLRENRRSYPLRTAVVDGEVRLTWPAFDDRVNQLANALATEAGVGAGDRILWLGQNSFRVLESLLAAAKLGAVFCPANWRQSADELGFVIDDTKAKVVIWQDEEIGDTVRAGRSLAAGGAEGRWLQHDAGADAEDSYERFLATGASDDPTCEIDPSSPVLQLYTAAFTGRPNGALLSHWAVLVQDLVMGNLQRVDSEYVYLNSGPLFHVATFMTVGPRATISPTSPGGTSLPSRSTMRTTAIGDGRPEVPTESPPHAFIVSMPMTSVWPNPAGRRAHGLSSTVTIAFHSGLPGNVRSEDRS